MSRRDQKEPQSLVLVYDPKYLNVETGPKRTSILDDLKFHFL